MTSRLPMQALLGTVAVLALSGCQGGATTRPYLVVAGGHPDHGKELIRSYGCGACHIVPGIEDARGLVGPPLLYFGQRSLIAGELPNTPQNLARWIENPKAVEPKTAMPDLGITPDQANDIAAYLYTLTGADGKQ